MLYVLDTNVVVDIQAGHPAVVARLLALPVDQLATTVITVEEQLSGWYTLLRRAKDRQQLARAYQRLSDNVAMLGCLPLLSFTEKAIERFERLKRLRLGVKHMDLRIAAIALEFGGTLVTRNIVDFKDVPGLIVEDWHTSPAS
jgi:tRNA(fMet)-specific endonuclease VapC